MKAKFILTASLLVAPFLSKAQVIVNETFESYANTPAMQANWGSSGAGQLVSTNGNTGNSGYHPGGAVNTWIGSSFSLTPDASINIRLRADIFDDGGGLDRNTIGLRNGANPLFEMGHYNSFASHYTVRLLSLYGGTGAWTAFPTVTRQTNAWHRYEAFFTLTNVTLTLDLGADGSIDSTLEFVGAPSANPFVDLRFGGPSGVSSAGPIWVDNILLETVPVPEPSTVALGCIGGLSLLVMAWRRRR